MLLDAFKDIVKIAGGEDAVLKMVEAADEAWNPGLKYNNVEYNGFVAVKVTKTTHIAEYFGIAPETLVSPYNVALSNNPGGLTAKFFCDVQLTTTAGSPGSLVRSGNCSAIQFDTIRPAVWNTSFPLAVTSPIKKLSNCGYNQCTFAP